jgi:hypothetical protein
MANTTKNIKNQFTMADVERLQIDIGGSFFMDWIGQNMTLFVDLLKKIVIPGSPELAAELENLHVEGVTLEKKFDNALVPHGRPKRNEELDEVHWLFIVKSEKVKNLTKLKKMSALNNDDFIVFNSYKKRMQLTGSHQFCQSYALFMAYNYYSGIPTPDTNPRDAYVELLKFWKLLIDNIGLCQPKHHSKNSIDIVLKPIISLNKSTEPNKELVDNAVKTFPKTLLSIHKLMSSEAAKIYCPTWV